MKKTLAVLLLGIVVTISMAFGGCTSSPGAAPTVAPTNAPADASASEPVPAEKKLSGDLTIWAWGADTEAQAREAAIKIFIAEHPELNVTYSIIPTADSAWDQKASAALAAGTAADVMQTSPDHYGLNTKYYLDLNPYVEADGVDLGTVLTPGMLDGYYDPDGKLEGFPLQANCFCVLYNKDMFDAKGVAYPKDGWTFEGMLDWGKAFVGGTGVNQTYAMARHWVTGTVMAYAGGGTPYSSDLKTSNFGSPEMLKSLQLYQKLVQGGYMPTDAAQTSIDASTLFISGKAAMYFAGGMDSQSIVADAKENGINLGVCSMPCGVSDGKEINIQFATGWAITKTSTNPDAAWQFLKESAYANADMAKETCNSGMPANKAVAGADFGKIAYADPSFTNQIFVDHMGATHVFPFGGTLSSACDSYWTMVSAVIEDNQDPAAVQAQYAPLIAEAWAKLPFNSASGGN
jgi:multiple sugar transport system substrate-binding protein